MYTSAVVDRAKRAELREQRAALWADGKDVPTKLFNGKANSKR